MAAFPHCMAVQTQVSPAQNYFGICHLFDAHTETQKVLVCDRSHGTQDVSLFSQACHAWGLLQRFCT